jgi:hypothetical protein
VFKGVLLTLLMGSGAPTPASPDVLDALTKVSISAAYQGRSGFQLDFTLETRAVASALLSRVGMGLDPAARVILIVTLGGVPTVLADGIITQHQFGVNEGGRTTLSLTGEDLSVMMDLVDATGLPYPAMEPHARVALVLARYAGFGVVPVVIPTIVFSGKSLTEGWSHQRGTDFAYITSLAQRAGYVFHMDPGPAPGTTSAYWGPEISTGAFDAPLTIDMGPASTVESLQFTLNVHGKTLPIVRIQEEESGAPILVPIPDVGILGPPLAAAPSPPVRITQPSRTSKLKPSEAVLFGLSLAARSNDTVSASGTLDVQRYGRLLKPRRIVAVRGAGPAYDGLYNIKRVSTEIKRGTCTQSFTLGRSGLFPTISGVSA